MRLVIQNAITIQIDKMLAEAANKKAIPSFFEITPYEASRLLREMNTCKCRDVQSKYEITQPDTENSTTHIKFRLFGGSLSDAEIVAIINDWYKGNVQISYRKYRIYIVKPAKTENKKELLDTANSDKFRRRLIRIR